MKKPAIPTPIGVQDLAVQKILTALKENVEQMSGVRGGTVEKLPEKTADFSTVVRKINELIDRINAY